jgi:chaperonin GroES
MLKYDKVRPLLNRILVKRIENPNKTSGGILLTNTGTSKVGLVLDIGNGKVTQKGDVLKPAVMPGQYVLLPDYGGVRVPKADNNDEEHWIYQEDDILGIAEGKFEKI